MTADELDALLDGIVPVVREYVAREIQQRDARIAELEQRAPVPGPAGRDGADGLTVIGPQGDVGSAG